MRGDDEDEKDGHAGESGAGGDDRVDGVEEERPNGIRALWGENGYFIYHGRRVRWEERKFPVYVDGKIDIITDFEDFILNARRVGKEEFGAG